MRVIRSEIMSRKRRETGVSGGTHAIERLNASPTSKRSGAQGRNRTTDTVIFSHVLYQLSYLGLAANAEVSAYRGG